MEETKNVGKINKANLDTLLQTEHRQEKRIEFDREKARNLFNIPDLLQGTKVIKTVYLEELIDEDGRVPFIEYGLLSADDVKLLRAEEDVVEQNKLEFYLRIKKALPDITKEQLELIPYDYMQLFFIKIRADNSFLFQALRNALNTSSIVAKDT
jgi:hypothetical protein